MANGTKKEKFLPIIYTNGTDNITINSNDFFIYSVDKYRIYKDRVELLDNIYLQSNKEIKKPKFKKEKNKEFIIQIFFNLVSAPIDYIRDGNFKIKEEKCKKKKKK